MTQQHVVRRLLEGSPLSSWLAADPWGIHLPAVCAVISGVKPVADLWIRARLVEEFKAFASQRQLHFHVDTYFDRFAEEALRASGGVFSTTRAIVSGPRAPTAEAHIFIARDAAALGSAIGAGWYPLVVGRSIVEKSVADHSRFGRALGYPDCCIRFFRSRNNWVEDNTLYAAYLNTRQRPSRLSNGLSRHTAFSLISHMPCSFSCDQSASQAAVVLEMIRKEAPAYGAETMRQLGLPMLSLSELRMFVFEGRIVNSSRIEYDEARPINPTRDSDALLALLQAGDACELDRSIIRVERRGAVIGVYFARGDQYGPECPFIVEPI